MFAIEFNEDNLPKILQTPGITVAEVELATDLYLRSPRTYFFIQNYFDRRGNERGWTIFPEYVVRDNFEYDPVKIQTDWDQIVRKS